jgi:hypothetical protein
LTADLEVLTTGTKVRTSTAVHPPRELKSGRKHVTAKVPQLRKSRKGKRGHHKAKNL